MANLGNQPDPTQQTEITPKIAPGGAAFAALDPANPKDQAAVRKAAQRWPKRWRGIDAAKKDRFVEGLVDATDVASRVMKEAQDPELALQAAQLVLSGVKTAAVLEGQNQADEHVQDKNERLDEGKLTERVGIPVKVIRGVDPDGL